MSSDNVLERLAWERHDRQQPAKALSFGVMPEKSVTLRRSRFDSISTLLFALLIVSSTFVGALGIVWLERRASHDELVSPLPPFTQGREDHPAGTQQDFEPPAAEELEALKEPSTYDLLKATTDLVSSVASSMESDSSNPQGNSGGTGHGDFRQQGPEQNGPPSLAPFERWQLTFSAKDLADYAKQLDYFKIELGAIGGELQGIDYASSLSTGIRSHRGPSEKELRLYFMWTTSNPLKRFDEQLLQQAGVITRNRFLLKFIEPELETQLKTLELAYAVERGYSSLSQIHKTVFESRPTAGGYEFVVIDQRYRDAK